MPKICQAFYQSINTLLSKKDTRYNDSFSQNHDENDVLRDGRPNMKQTRCNTSSCRGWVPLAKMSGNWVVYMKSTHTASWDMSKILCKQCREYQMLPPCQASFYRALETDGKQTTWNCHHGLQCIKQEKCIKSIYKWQFKGQAFQRRTYTVSKVSKTTAACTGRCSLKTWMQKAHCVYIYHCHRLQRKRTQSCKSNEPHHLSPAIPKRPALGDHIKAKTLAGSLKHDFHRGKEALKTRLQKDLRYTRERVPCSNLLCSTPTSRAFLLWNACISQTPA